MEVVVSTMIVGLMTVAALNGLGAAIRSGESAKNRSIALELADDLINEILNKPYQEVDDFDGWDQCPPRIASDQDELYRYPEDDEFVRFSKFRQRVVVENVSASDPSKVIGGLEQGAKRICVTIEYDGTPLVRRYAVVTDYKG